MRWRWTSPRPAKSKTTPGVRARRVARALLAACPVLAPGSGAQPAFGQAPCHYDVTVLPNHSCGIFSSPANPVAINNLGHVLLGGANCGNPVYDESFLWTGGPTLTPIPRPSYMLGFAAQDLNDDDIVVGTAVTTYAGQRAFIYDSHSGVWTELPPLNPPTGWSGALAISNNNVVCGFRSIGSPGDPVNPRTAFIWSAAQGFHDLGIVNGYSTTAGRINIHGMCSGEMALGKIIVPFLWDGVHLVQVPSIAGFETHPGGLNDWNSLAGYALTGASPINTRAFLWRNGLQTELLPLRGFGRAAAGNVSDGNVVVGTSAMIGSDTAVATVWINAIPHALPDLVQGAQVDLGSAGHMSANGRILALGSVNGTAANMILTPRAPVGDVNGNCLVDVNDLLGVIIEWGQSVSPADLNHDHVVNALDLIMVIDHWGST